MDAKMLDKKYHIDSETGCRCRYIRSDTEYFRPHWHNYCEIFLVIKGDVRHFVNSHNYVLTEGHLLFIRDSDVHDYSSADGNLFEFINLSFDKSILEDMFNYLGAEFPSDKLISAPTPPAAKLSFADKEKLFYSMTELNDSIKAEDVRIKLKALLIKVFTRYFYNFSQEKTDIPIWLEMTLEKMKNPKNFILGTKRMYEICGKSREHLSRSMKKYFGTTPSEYISDLRLEYCVNLLLTSNLSVTDICFECGFDNISWFYKLFFSKYGATPTKYRKKYMQ